jgi:hypothetical protein
MPVVVQYTTEVGSEEYDQVALAIRFHDEPPPGLIVHTAAVTGDGKMRVLDVWQTLEAHDRFVEQRLKPATLALVGDRIPVWPEPEVHHLHSLVNPLGAPVAGNGLRREFAGPFVS